MLSLSHVLPRTKHQSYSMCARGSGKKQSLCPQQGEQLRPTMTDSTVTLTRGDKAVRVSLDDLEVWEM